MFKKLCFILLIVMLAGSAHLTLAKGNADLDNPDSEILETSPDGQEVYSQAEIEKGPEKHRPTLYWWIALFIFIAGLQLIGAIDRYLRGKNRNANKISLAKGIEELVAGGIKMEPGMKLTADGLSYPRPEDLKPPDPETTKRLGIEARQKGITQDMRNSIMWAAVGLGVILPNLVIYFWLESITALVFGSIGFFSLSIGLGYLILWQIGKQRLSTELEQGI